MRAGSSMWYTVGQEAGNQKLNPRCMIDKWIRTTQAVGWPLEWNLVSICKQQVCEVGQNSLPMAAGDVMPAFDIA